MDSFISQIESNINTARQDVINKGLSYVEIQGIDYGVKKYIKDLVSLLISEERNEMRQSSDSTNRILLILLILYIISLVIFYVSWAYPMASKFNTEVQLLLTQIKVTFKMLNMIPFKVIQSIDTIRDFLLNWSRKNNVSWC
jgi:flagellar biosynthesis protein FlhB